jgi:hypothetical protein
MLGIVSARNNSTLSRPPYIFLYYTEEAQRNPNNQNLEEPTIRNRLYRYELAYGKLIGPRLLLDLPSGPKTIHNGGAITAGLTVISILSLVICTKVILKNLNLSLEEQAYLR